MFSKLVRLTINLVFLYLFFVFISVSIYLILILLPFFDIPQPVIVESFLAFDPNIFITPHFVAFFLLLFCELAAESYKHKKLDAIKYEERLQRCWRLLLSSVVIGAIAYFLTGI